MQVKLEDLETGWFGLMLGLTDGEIVTLIDRLKELREHKGHFHARSDFVGAGGVGDIEFYWSAPSEAGGLTIE